MDYQNAEFYKLNKNNPDLVFNYVTGTVTYRKESDENGNIRIVEYRKDYGKKGTERRSGPEANGQPADLGCIAPPANRKQ